MKERVINEILMQMEPHISIENLRILENVIIKALYYVEIMKKETELSTEMDDNEYLLQLYEMTVKKDGLSEKTIRNYMAAMRNMLCLTNKNIRRITSIDIKFYLDRYAGKGNKARTVNNERRYLSAVFSWYRKHSILSVNPVEAVPARKEHEKPIDYMNGEEIEKLRVACKDKRERALMEFLLSTGVRVGEVPLIEREEIDWEKGEILIYAHKTDEYRTVFLTDVARMHLEQYIQERRDNSPALFGSIKGEHDAVHEDGLRTIVKNIAGRAGLKRRVYPHLFRKTMASILRMKGCRIEDIQAMLGHKSAATTIKYYSAADKNILRRMHNQYLSVGVA